MWKFSNLMTSNFGDSTAPIALPLEPRLKKSVDAANAPSPAASFHTPVGERRVPREKDPRKPSFEMIKDARQGILSGFLRSGIIFRASEFIGIVNPKTAVITLNDVYDFETRRLAAIIDQPAVQPPSSAIVPLKRTADDEKTLRNLFYISLNPDELPSFHFWTKPGDLDPVTAGESIDWDKFFDKNPPSPATTAKIAMLENERKGAVQRGAEEHQSTQNKQPLEFLNRYNDSSLPGSDRERTAGRPASDTDPIPHISASSIPVQSLPEVEVLLQFNRGGMYLRELTHKAFYAMARWLVKNEEEEEEMEERKKGEDKNEARRPKVRDMFLDVLEPGRNLRVEKISSVSHASSRHFQQRIKPLLSQPDNKFRIRSTRYQSSWNLGSDFDAGGVGDLKYDLKLLRPNVGYCYCSANWHITGNLSLNSACFEKAIKFLFDWEISAHPNSNHLSLDIPKHSSFDLNRNSGVVIDAKIQKIFAELSPTPAKADSHPAQIFIRDVVEIDTDGSDFLGTSPRGRGNVQYGNGFRDAPSVRQSISGPASRLDRQSNGHRSRNTTETGGGPDLSSIQPQFLTDSDVIKLQERLKIAEASNVETDDLQEQLRIANGKLSEMSGLEERLKISENRAKLKSTCPFCAQDWAGATIQQQQDHLRLHQKSIVHQPAPQQCPQPNCTTWLGENHRESTYEAISEHLRLHIEEGHLEDGICEHELCHANMYSLTAEQHEEHESIHRDNAKTEEERNKLREQVRDLRKTLEERNRMQAQAGSLGDVQKERDLRQEQARNLERKTKEYDRLQQEVKYLKDERVQLQEDLVRRTEECNSLQKRIERVEGRVKTAPSLDKGMQAKEAEPETEVDKGSKQPNQPEDTRLRYCNVCLKSVDKFSADAKARHAEKCETSVSGFLLLKPGEAKAEREKRNKSRDVATPQALEGTDEGPEVSVKGKKGKQKTSAELARSESQQDEAENANTGKQPGATKATGRKALKRNYDTFKPSKEDESEDEEVESLRKRPKLKAKAAKKDEGTAPTRRSTRGKDNYHPSKEEGEDEDDEDDEEESNEPSSSGNGRKRKRTAAAVTTVSKKVKTKK